MSTSCTTSLASSRCAIAGSSRKSIMRRIGSRCRASNRSTASASPALAWLSSSSVLFASGHIINSSTKGHQGPRREMANLPHEPFPFEFADAAEINEHADTSLRCLQLVEELSFISPGELSLCLDFNHDAVITRKICDKELFEHSFFVKDRQPSLRFVWNIAVPQFDAHGFLINRFKKTWPKDTMDLNGGPDNRVDFVLVNQFFHISLAGWSLRGPWWPFVDELIHKDEV